LPAWPTIVSACKAAAGAIGSIVLYYNLPNILNSDNNDKGGLPHKPPFKGEPNSTGIGKGQTRRYGPDGYPEVDRDAPHGGGADIERDDHSHDWDRPEDGSKPTHDNRGKPRPPKPNDPPKPIGYN